MTLALPLLWLAACPGSATGEPAPPDTAAGTASVTCGAERCNNGLDDDCDGVVDEADDAVDALAVYADADGDGYAGDVAVGTTCDAAVPFTTITDCDDADPLVNPAAEEVCDGIDNNCDWYGVPGCEWAGEVALDEVATMVVHDEVSDVAAGVDEETGEPWVMTFELHARVGLYHGIHAGNVTPFDANALFELHVDYQDPWYKEREYVYVGCGDVADLDGDGLSDVILGLDAFDQPTGSFARLFAVRGPMDGGRKIDLATAEGSFVGDGFVNWGGSQCGAGLDATGDAEPDVLAVGLAGGSALILSGQDALSGRGELQSRAAGSVGVAGTLRGGGWADLSGDGVADVFTIDDAADEGVALRLFQGPVHGAVSSTAADVVVFVAATPDLPDRQPDLTGDGRDDLLYCVSDEREGSAVLLDGGHLSQGGGDGAAFNHVATFVGSIGRSVQQVAGAGSSLEEDRAAVVISHCGVADYSGWGPCEDGGFSVVPGPFLGRVEASDAATFYVSDRGRRRVGSEISAIAGVALVSAELPWFDDPYGESHLLYAVPIDEAY